MGTDGFGSQEAWAGKAARRKVRTRKWVAKAEQVFKTKEHLGVGYGRWAVYTECRVPTFSLHASREAAEAAKRTVDDYGCGGQCPLGSRTWNHRVVDLASV